MNVTEKSKMFWESFVKSGTIDNVDKFCDVIIPKEEEGAFYLDAAKMILRSILILCKYRKETSYDSFLKYLSMSQENLKALFDETPNCEVGSKMLADKKTGENVMAVLESIVHQMIKESKLGMHKRTIFNMQSDYRRKSNDGKHCGNCHYSNRLIPTWCRGLRVSTNYVCDFYISPAEFEGTKRKKKKV